MKDREEFGPGLRRERERRGIGLRAIAEHTKISASFFEALERNDVSRWPGGIFRRAFLRAYAEAVGLDVEATLSEFLRLFPCDGEAAQLKPAGPRDVTIVHSANKPTGAKREVHVPSSALPQVRTQTLFRRIAAVAIDIAIAGTAGVGAGLLLGWAAAWPALAISVTFQLIVNGVFGRGTVGGLLLGTNADEANATPEASAADIRPAAKRRTFDEPYQPTRRHQVRRGDRPRARL